MGIMTDGFEDLCHDLVDIAEVLDNNGYGAWASNVRTASELLKAKDAEIKELIAQQDVRCELCGRERVVHCRECVDWVRERKHCKRTSWTHGGNWYCGYGKRKEAMEGSESV